MKSTPTCFLRIRISIVRNVSTVVSPPFRVCCGTHTPSTSSWACNLLRSSVGSDCVQQAGFDGAQQAVPGGHREFHAELVGSKESGNSRWDLLPSLFSTTWKTRHSCGATARGAICGVAFTSRQSSAAATAVTQSAGRFAAKAARAGHPSQRELDFESRAGEAAGAGEARGAAAEPGTKEEWYRCSSAVEKESRTPEKQTECRKRGRRKCVCSWRKHLMGVLNCLFCP